MYIVQSKTAVAAGDTSLPQGVRLVAWSRSVRWIGWGFGEALLPVFIFQLSHNLAEAGFLRAMYSIALLVALPTIGFLVDRYSAKRLMMLAFALYPLVGLSYFFAGTYNTAIFIVVASLLSGFLHGAEAIGVSTYYRRITARATIGLSFGYIDTWANLGWIFAALAGAYLVGFIPIYCLLLAIAPAAIISMIIAQRAPKDALASKHASDQFPLAAFIAELRSWPRKLWLLCAVSLLMAIVASIMWFFIPIDAYIHGAKPLYVILLTIVATIPTLAGYWFGKLADRRNKDMLFMLGLAGIALAAVGLALFPNYTFRLAASFALGLIVELFSVLQASLLTTLGSATTYGLRAGLFGFITTIGMFGAPLVIGYLLGAISLAVILWLVAAFGALLAVCFCISWFNRQSHSFQ